MGAGEAAQLMTDFCRFNAASGCRMTSCMQLQRQEFRSLIFSCPGVELQVAALGCRSISLHVY